MVAVAVLAAAGLALLLVHFMGTTVVVVVRAPVEASPPSDDAPLSDQEQQRARNLAVLFGERGAQGSLDALYVSEVPGARETLAPLAERLGKQPVPVPAAVTPGSMAARMMHEHSGGAVLVVASGEQVPAVVRALSGTVVPPGDADYIVSIPTIGQANLVRFQY
jgi:hypothetical protein